MIILAFYVSSIAHPEWIVKFVKHLNTLQLHQHDILPILLTSDEVHEGSAKVECVYPRFSFEYEVEESESLQEVIDKLEERLRMQIS